MPQLWQGRASKAVDSRVNDFNSSIRFDARMIEQDIQGSLVHSAMLGRQGIISQQDVDDIHKGLHAWVMQASGCTPAAAATTRWHWTSA
mgnify:CR=1 FL=1